MKKTVQLIFCLKILFVISGCAVVPYEITPHISGYILDHEDKTPIKDASIYVIYAGEPSLQHSVAKTTSDASGYFDIPKITRWGFWIFLQEPYAPIGYEIKVDSKDYCPYIAPLAEDYWKYNPKTWTNVEILLHKISSK